ncbi:MAG: hypothetical protein JKX78_10645 [Alteromonadaceae bacterium]|nr:hypothetical protein [Alteromonadaceae bacterium]
MKTLLKTLLILPISLVLLACGAGNGENLNDQGRPNTETPALVPPENPPSDPPTIDPNIISANLTSIQAHVFTPICSSCHGGANPAAGQDLSTIENSIANLINVQSSNPLFKRVLPSSPEKSYLYLKVTGNEQAGSRMPLGQPSLSDNAIKAIKNWITQGAIVPDNIMTPTQINNVKITSKKVDSVKAGTNQQQQIKITITFNQAINFTTLTNEQISMGQYINEQLIPIASNNISFNIINTHNLTVSLTSDLTLTATNRRQHFNLLLNNPNLSTITSIAGQMLDGDLDGIDGGVFSYDFSL